MEYVTSRDGTTIAFDRLGDGPPVVLVCGGSVDRMEDAPLAQELGSNLAVLNYDRRGRGPDEVKAAHRGRDLDRQGIGGHDRCRANNAVSRQLHLLDSGIEPVVQPQSAVRADDRDVWVVAQEPVRFPVSAPPAIAQSPQPVGIGDPHGALFVFRKGPRPAL